VETIAKKMAFDRYFEGTPFLGNGFHPSSRGNYGISDLSKTPAQRWLAASVNPPGKIGTRYTGRSIPVREGNVLGAYYGLNSILGQNNVRRELKLGERYEKPTERRRRIQSERHRRRFAQAVGRRSASSTRSGLGRLASAEDMG